MYWDDEQALEDYGEAGWSIWDELVASIANWKDTYREYWGLGTYVRPEEHSEEVHKVSKFDHELAGIILKGVSSLTLAGASENADVNVTANNLKWLRKALREKKASPVVRDWVGLQLAEEAIQQASSSTDRAFRLLGVIQGRRLSDRASAYLSRVTRLYVLGLEIETGAMCRSALEAALLSCLEKELNQDSEPPALRDLIRIAGEEGFLEGFEAARNKKGWRAKRESPLWRATRLQRAGNFIMHEFAHYPPEADAIHDGFEAVRDLALVLAGLFPPATFE